MDFPQQPQGATPFPSAPQPTTPPPFPNVSATPAAGPLPGPTMPPLGSVPPSVQIPVQSHPQAMTSNDEQVYTMPDKFLAAAAPVATRSKKPSKALTIILIVVIVLMVLAAIGGVLYYFLVIANRPVTQTTAQNAVVVNTNNANANVNAVVNDNTNVVANANANSNTNSNVNDNVNVANANVNAVVNDNTNVVANANTTVNDNSNANVNVSVNDNTNAAVTVPPASKDADADSLTNDEEKIWSTKADLPDTDTDGYADGIEILAGYDPTSATGRLSASALISTFANTEYGYTMLYPKNWLAESLDSGDASEVLFTPNTLDLAGQFLAVTVTENPTGLTALDWYVDTANVEETAVVSLVAFDGATGVWSTDRTTAYFANSNNVYAVSYRYGNSDELFFPTSFEMMVKSFALTAKTDTQE